MTDTSLTDLKQRLREFAAARDWDDVNGFTNVAGAWTRKSDQFEVQDAFMPPLVQMSCEHREVRNDHSPKILKMCGIDTHGT